MKIGIMLRHYEQHGGGVKVYTQNLLRELLKLNTQHEFVLLYRNPKLIGTYGDHDHVREIAIKTSSIFMWDQVAVRWVEKREKLDMIFNPKYSIPLTAKCKTVYVSHGLNQFVLPLPKPLADQISHRFLRLRYAKKADAIIAVSKITREHVIKYLKVPADKVHTVYLGVDQVFRKLMPVHRLNEIRQTYRLPEKFFLYVGQIYPPKNFGRLLQAFAKVGPELNISLVVAGEHRWLCGEELSLIESLGISNWVVRLGWIDHETLPALYKMAEALLMPSLYEACPSPPIEAMACGCPVVTSNRFGTKEIADKAAIFVDPEDVESIANGIHHMITNEELRLKVIEAGHERSRSFSWEKCAQETLWVLEEVLSTRN
jgi:glycosyltransferase involved in cell wall biosynthesis